MLDERKREDLLAQTGKTHSSPQVFLFGAGSEGKEKTVIDGQGSYSVFASNQIRFETLKVIL